MLHDERLERRQFGRRRTVIHAWLLLKSHREMPCVVRNLSPSGALLEVEFPGWVPFRFKLRFEDGSEVDCECRHRGEHGVGVLFSTQPDVAGLDGGRSR